MEDSIETNTLPKDIDKKEIIKNLRFAAQKKFKEKELLDASTAEGSFPCILICGQWNYYLGHFHDGVWYKHGFDRDSDGNQIQTEEPIDGVLFYVKLKKET